MKTRIYSITAVAIALAAQTAFAVVTGAAWTTDVSGTTNENHYAEKCDVYLNGGPQGQGNSALLPGLYYYQVTNTSGDKTLSTSAAATRTLVVGADGNVSTPVQLCQFSPSGNGVYKAWLIYAEGDCQVQVDPDDIAKVVVTPNIASCSKTDNFSIDSETGGICQTQPECCENPQGCSVTAFPPTIGVSKTAEGLYDLKWLWDITKSGCAIDGGNPTNPCQKTFKQVGGSVAFQYKVTVTPVTAVRKNDEVMGTITISASPGNDAAGNPVEARDITLEDKIAYGPSLLNDPAATCVFDDPVPSTLGFTPSATVAYHCTYNAPPQDPVGEVNQVTMRSTNGINPITQANEADAFVPFVFNKDQDLDTCVSVTDKFGTAATVPVGSACLTDPPIPTVITYSNSITPVFNTCVRVTNTATFTASQNVDLVNGQAQSNSAQDTMTVCGAVRSGAHTMGFWQNKNGQGLIMGSPTTSTLVSTKYVNVCNVGAWLRNTFGSVFTSDIPANATCAQTATGVNNIIKIANAGTTMSAMLKGQMLATALSVYFSSASQGGDVLKNFGGGTNVGAVDIDITKVCKNIATCTTYDYNANQVFGYTHNAVMQLLLTASGSIWTENVRASQETAKNVFDAINNNVAFGYTL